MKRLPTDSPTTPSIPPDEGPASVAMTMFPSRRLTPEPRENAIAALIARIITTDEEPG